MFWGVSCGEAALSRDDQTIARAVVVGWLIGFSFEDTTAAIFIHTPAFLAGDFPTLEASFTDLPQLLKKGSEGMPPPRSPIKPCKPDERRQRCDTILALRGRANC